MRRRTNLNRTSDGVALRDLLRMTRAELLDAWARIVGRSPIRSASRELLVNAIAWHLQARQYGGLSPSVQGKLERLAAAIDRGETRTTTLSNRPPPPEHDPGTAVAGRDSCGHRDG